MGCHTLGFAFCARLRRTVWVVGVLDGMSSRLNEFRLPTGCLNSAGTALVSQHNTKLLSYMYYVRRSRLSCEMMWLRGLSGEIGLDFGREQGVQQSSGRGVHGSEEGSKEAN